MRGGCLHGDRAALTKLWTPCPSSSEGSKGPDPSNIRLKRLGGGGGEEEGQWIQTVGAALTLRGVGVVKCVVGGTGDGDSLQTWSYSAASGRSVQCTPIFSQPHVWFFRHRGCKTRLLISQTFPNARTNNIPTRLAQCC
jgi:hypothetical protein